MLFIMTLVIKSCFRLMIVPLTIGLFSIFYTLAATAEPLTLEQAWKLAEQANPILQTAQSNLAASQGALAEARAPLFNNPQITADIAHRDVFQADQAGASNFEGAVGLSQTFEIAGQQGKRRSAAQAALAATKETIAATRRQVRADVEQRFVQVLSLQLRIQDEGKTLKLIEKTSAAVKKRVTAGEDTRLDGNLAKVEAERARNQVDLLKEQLIEARAILAALLQLPKSSLPEVSGTLDPAPLSYNLEALIANTAKSPALRALDLREDAARNRLDLERASAYPDVTVGLSYGNEVGPNSEDKITTLNISVPLPLFRRNQTGIGRAVSDLAQVQIEKQAATRDTAAQVIALSERVDSLRTRVKRLSKSVLPNLEENQRLSTLAYRAGEIGLTQLLLVTRQVLDGRRDLLDARTELRLASSTLTAAAIYSDGVASP